MHHSPGRKGSGGGAAGRTPDAPTRSREQASGESSLQQESLRYRQLLENIPLVMLRWDLKSQRFTFMNIDQFWSGHTLEELNQLGPDPIEELIHPDDLDDYKTLMARWERSGRKEPLVVEYRLRRTGSDYTWIQGCRFLERSPADKPVAIVELSRDIGGRKRAEMELEELRTKVGAGMEEFSVELSRVKEELEQELTRQRRLIEELSLREEGFRNLVAGSIDGILVAAGDHSISFANSRACEITGYSKQELLKTNIRQIVTPEEYDRVVARIEKRTGDRRPPRQFETQIRHKNGETSSVELSAVRTVWQGTAADVFSIRDIRERRLAQGKRISSLVRRAVEQRYTFEGMVSKSRAILMIFDTLPTIARSDSSLLIMGESGTGKELMARAIHRLSPRREAPLVTINSAALPDTLIESELFGYKRGAFTDAKADKPGRFVEANGGTLFLDEIGDISPAMQVKLLRVLEDKMIQPLGGKESVKVDFRFLAATNRDLDRVVEEGGFRRDLFYRINVVRVVIPPLRERLEDIPILVEHFLGKFNALFGKDITSVSPEAMGLLMDYHYPGNIRELENFIEHAFLLCRGDKIMAEQLPDILNRNRRAGVGLTPAPLQFGPTPGTDSTMAQVSELEARMIVASLERHRWNRTAAARELGIHRITISRKIRKYGIALPGMDGRTARRNVP